METAAIIILRVVYAWIFFRPLPGLIKDFKGSVDLVSLIVPFWQRSFTVIMLLVMFFGALSILFGMYAQIGGIFLFCYCIIGYFVHQKLAAQLTQSTNAPVDVVNLGVIGHVTSAQKNIVLAGVALFFELAGRGHVSVTANIF